MNNTYSLKMKLNSYLEIRDPHHGLLFTGINKAADWYLGLALEDQMKLVDYIVRESTSLDEKEIQQLSLLGEQLRETEFEKVIRVLNEL